MADEEVEIIMKCPRCGNTTFIIHEKLKYTQYWTIDGNKLYKTDKDSPSPTGEIWLYCDECLQNDIEMGYQCTEEQSRRIQKILIEPRSFDITEFMGEDFDWRTNDED